ncbi:FdtA/QdtA family cupin domain-containing protein [Vibrio lentus]
MEKKWSLISIDSVVEGSGTLKVAELNKHFDFKIERLFYLTNIKDSSIRGAHAHEELQQFIVCISGSYTIDLDDGYNKESIFMNENGPSLLVDGLVWRTMRNFSSDAVMLVLCDRVYSEDRVLRNYDEFTNRVFEK